MELALAEFWKIVSETEYKPDGRWMTLARTHFEEGFMALRRAIHQDGSGKF